MKKKRIKMLSLAVGLLVVFVAWTLLVMAVDVSPIGPEGSKIGFSAFNSLVHRTVGVNMSLYVITDWLGLVPIATVLGFAALGLCQLIKRKSLLKVDRSIIILGGFYVAVAAVFLLFEVLAVNYRPVLIEGCLEASYPSSTTMLVLCVMPTAVMQLSSRIKSQPVKLALTLLIIAFIAFMVIGRILSGVHWITDIIGGALLSAGLVGIYRALS
jgi:undecaprenyl-diphosphatase